MNRRDFLSTVGKTAISLPLVGVGTTFSVTPVFAANPSDYRALVCVFFLGGLDTHDVLIPYDQPSYDAWVRIRNSLVSAQGQTRARANLLPIASGSTVTASGTFALPPEMPLLHSLYQQGRVAIAANVGPLISATTRSDFQNEAVPLPPRLFSHNDQQSVWQASAPEGAQFGWGGLFADAMLSAGANQVPEFSTITSLGNELFLTGQVAKPYQVGLDGAAQVDFLADEDVPAALKSVLRRHFAGESADQINVISRDLGDAFAGALTANERYDAATASAEPFNTVFPTSPLGAQLRAVAQAISVRSQLQAQRQIFFVGIGGFDTHSAQATDLPGLLTQIDGALAAFYQSMQELALGSNVTLFTASDFGRTLVINGDGTDHGWGAHHLVMGDAVSGGQIHGFVPPAQLDHDYDSGGGRLIPTTSVEQYAAPLGRWFGLSETELLAALPNRANFATEPSLIIA
ncbi:MAG: DUF1501 domain-containing protein [Pseudomonadota bacterium]